MRYVSALVPDNEGPCQTPADLQSLSEGGAVHTGEEIPVFRMWQSLLQVTIATLHNNDATTESVRQILLFRTYVYNYNFKYGVCIIYYFVH